MNTPILRDSNTPQKAAISDISPRRFSQISAPSRVPLEISELIIDEVSKFKAPGRIAALKACALTCRSFVNRSQRHIFHSFNDRSIGIETYLRFAEAITMTPELALYVKEFRIFDDAMSDTMYLNHPSFPIVLGMLKNLQDFDLGILLGAMSPDFGWKDFTHEVKNALACLFQSPLIMSVSLTAVFDLPPAVAELLLGVPYVRLDGVSFDSLSRWAPDYCASPNPQRYMKTLRISCQFPLPCSIEQIQPLYDVLSSNKCKLETFVMDYDELDIAEDIMQRTNTTLTTLVCRVGRGCGSYKYDNEIFDMSMLTHLQILNLQTYCNKKLTERVIDLLYEVPDENEIREIVIELFLRDRCWEEECDWEELDGVLAAAKFDNVQSVVFNVTSGYICSLKTDHFDQLDFIRCLEDLLPNTNNKRNLQVHFVEYSDYD